MSFLIGPLGLMLLLLGWLHWSQRYEGASSRSFYFGSLIRGHRVRTANALLEIAAGIVLVVIGIRVG